ncbi:MAG TPA: thioredoxin family protein [Longimicrobiaceae bacterium]|nr:thioredoxin family protein [Longimicrobiaceae bacterium]
MKLLYFRAEWCGVCREKGPVVEEAARSLGLPLEVLDWDEERGRAEAEARRIRTVPTLALVHGDRVPFQLVGRMITPENVAHFVARVRPAGGPPAP